MTMLEIMIVITILVVALATYGSTVATLSMWGPINRENALALAAARGTVEELYSVAVSEAFSRYNLSALDDPATGTSPGNFFAVRGLDPRQGDPDGFVGEIVFPNIGTELREDSTDADLGMPRDLDGDGAVDAANHAADYIILPVLIRLQWTGRAGDRELEVTAALADL